MNKPLIALILSVGLLMTGQADAQPTSKRAIAAFKHYEKKAQQGTPQAQFEFGLVFSNGKIVPKDNAKAAQ